MLTSRKIADNSNYVSLSKYEALAADLAAARNTDTSKTGELERDFRTLQEENRMLKEEAEEVQAEIASQSRGTKRQIEEAEAKHSKLVQTMDELRLDLKNKDSALDVVQRKLSEREAELDTVEAENVKLRAQGGDAEEVVIIKRELTEQMSHIRKLESTNREQTTELRKLRDRAKAVAVIEEEKKVLEIQVQRMDQLERELGESRFQRQVLEDEKMSWRSYLQNSTTGEEAEFDTPEAMARALASERSERASLFDKFGQLQPELTAKAAEISSLQAEIEKLKKTAPVDPVLSNTSEAKVRARLERQKALAQKEVEYLRAQLKTFETEDTTNVDLDAVPSIDQATKARISTLEDLVNQYRKELDTANQTLYSTTLSAVPPAEKSLKRPSPSPDESERIGMLTRKLQTMQNKLTKAESEHRTLSNELSATKTQLTHLQSTSRTRILSLRSNPTDTFSSEKASTISTLRQENKDLHTQLNELQSTTRNTSTTKPIPASYLTSARSEIATLQTQLASSEKRLTRLRQIWSSKSLEFRAAVASLLGWRMDFLPGGKFRLTSLFHPSLTDEGKEEDERVWDTSFIFDGENGTMKIAGGAKGAFAKEVGALVRFWVEERKEIPGFLAACTMEWVEGVTRG